jgi:2-methylisocitrate lyase-like PEP mutase family enzyme
MRTEEEGIRVAKEVPGLLLYNVSSSGQAPHLHVSRLKELGYRLVIYPAHTLFFAIHGIKELLTDLKRDGDISSWLDQMIDFQEWQRLTEVPQIEDLERRYSGQEG